MKEQYRVKEVDTSSGRRRYRFVSFTERLGKVKIRDVFRQFEQSRSTPEDGSATSWFSARLTHWREFNHTGDFNALNRDLYPFVHSLAEVLFNKEKIVDILLQHALTPDSRALEAILDLLSNLARDLRQEFYPFYPRILGVLVELIDPRHPALLEQLLGYLFKFLQKQMLADLETAFRCYRILLAHPRPHIRSFAAESFAFLLRKTKPSDYDTVLRMVLSLRSVDETEANAMNTSTDPCNESDSESETVTSRMNRNNTAIYDEGRAQLLFETVRGVKTQFNSTVEHVLERVLFFARDPMLSIEQRDRAATIMHSLLNTMCEHTRGKHAAPVWKCMLDNMSTVCAEWSLTETDETWRSELAGPLVVTFLTDLVHWASHRNGSRITQLAPLMSSVSNLIKHGCGEDSLTSPEAEEQILQLLASILMFLSNFRESGQPLPKTAVSSLIKQALKCVSPVAAFKLVARICAVYFFDDLLLKYVLRFVNQHASQELLSCMLIINTIYQERTQRLTDAHLQIPVVKGGMVASLLERLELFYRAQAVHCRQLPPGLGCIQVSEPVQSLAQCVGSGSGAHPRTAGHPGCAAAREEARRSSARRTTGFHTASTHLGIGARSESVHAVQARD